MEHAETVGVVFYIESRKEAISSKFHLLKSW